MNLSDYLRDKLPLIEKRLQELVPQENSSYAPLFEAARYSIFSSGKRIRPLLVLASTEAVGGRVEDAMSPACAIELLHTYSLIHDDLPCMDDDDYRRGKPTLHKVYPEWHALLAGDFLLTYAFEVLLKSPSLTADQKVQLTTILASRAGGHGMVGGQLIDMISEGKPLSLTALEQLHKMKTGALLIACLEFGGIVAQADEREMALLREFGQLIGLAFQIVDDILDVTASEAKHGKTISSDQLNQKTTYVTLLGIQRCREEAQTLYQKALGILSALKGNTAPLQELAQHIIQREY